MSLKPLHIFLFGLVLFWQVSSAVAGTNKNKMETFAVPHWISLLPIDLNNKHQAASSMKESTCASENAEAWQLQLAASEIAASNAGRDVTLRAAELAEAALKRQRECELRSAKQRPLIFEHDLYSEPDINSIKVGRLQLRVHFWSDNEDADDDQVESLFIDMQGKETKFLPDIPFPFEERPGAFHTVLARTGDWYQLPRKPFSKPVWLRLAPGKSNAVVSILDLVEPVLVKVNGTSTYVIFKSTKDLKLIGFESIENRGKRPPNSRKVEVELADLFDESGHIRARWRSEN